MFKKTPFWLRAIEGEESGGSAGAAPEPEKGTDAPEETPKDDPQDNDGDSGEQIDWEARYKQSQQEIDKWKSHSRKWEERAKAKNDPDSESGDIRARLAQVEQDLKESRAEAQRAETARIKLEIGAEYGLSKDVVDELLHGTEEDMHRQAEHLQKLSEHKSSENPLQGRGGKGDAKQRGKEWYEKLAGKNK